MDRKTKTLRDRVLEHLAILRIPLPVEELDQVLEAAERDHLSVLAAFDRLLGEQAARRRDRGITRRIVAAKFAEQKTLDTFDWTFNKTITRTQYEQLATGDFIRRHINVVLVGQSGVGKSHLMQAVGMSACAVGYRVFYTTSSGLLSRLTAALADRSLTETLRWYANWDLVVIDEFGLDQIEREECPKAAHLLYKVIVSRHHKRSTILITNILCVRTHKMRSKLLRGVSSFETPRFSHRAGFSLRITAREVRDAISLSLALNRPLRSFGGIIDSSASSFTDGSARV
jgi:DNA replication protein DnaC